MGGRTAILQLYGDKVPLAKDVDLEQIARGTPGFSGAELSNLINQAALKASIEGRKAIDMHALEYAKDKIMMVSVMSFVAFIQHGPYSEPYIIEIK